MLWSIAISSKDDSAGSTLAASTVSCEALLLLAGPIRRFAPDLAAPASNSSALGTSLVPRSRVRRRSGDGAVVAGGNVEAGLVEPVQHARESLGQVVGDAVDLVECRLRHRVVVAGNPVDHLPVVLGDGVGQEGAAGGLSVGEVSHPGFYAGPGAEPPDHGVGSAFASGKRVVEQPPVLGHPFLRGIGGGGHVAHERGWAGCRRPTPNVESALR